MGGGLSAQHTKSNTKQHQAKHLRKRVGGRGGRHHCNGRHNKTTEQNRCSKRSGGGGRSHVLKVALSPKHRGTEQILDKNAIFDDFEIFNFFDFFVFFGWSENFGGRLWRCACGCQYDVRISQDSLDLIMMAYIFSPPLALPWKSCEKSMILLSQIARRIF